MDGPGDPPQVVRLPIVGVMGSHRTFHASRAAPLGRWLARERYHLLTGAGGGVMAAVSRAFAGVADREGRVIGVVPTSANGTRRRPLPGYPNPWVEIPVYGHLDAGGPRGDEPSSRNHVNVLTSNVVVLLPGGEGTASEARLALRYQTPCIAFVGGRGDIPDLPAPVAAAADLDAVTRFIQEHAPLPDRLSREGGPGQPA